MTKTRVINIYDEEGKLIERDFINISSEITIEKDFYSNKKITEKDYFNATTGILTEKDMYVIYKNKSILSEKIYLNEEGAITQKDYVNTSGKTTEKDFYNSDNVIIEKDFYSNSSLTEKDYFDSLGVVTDKDYYKSGKIIKTALYEEGNLTEINFFAKNILTEKDLYTDDVLTKKNFYTKGVLTESELYTNNILTEKNYFNSSQVLTEKDLYTDNKVTEKDYLTPEGITFEKDYLDSKGKIAETDLFNDSSVLSEKDFYTKGTLTQKNLYENGVISTVGFYTKNVVTEEDVYTGGNLAEKNFYTKKVLTEKELYTDGELTQRNLYTKGLIKESELYTNNVLAEKDYYLEGILTEKDTIAPDGSISAKNYYDGDGDLITGTGVITKGADGDYVVLYGQPNYWGNYLDYKQGDNDLKYCYDCGLAATENVLIEMGVLDKRSKSTFVKGVDTEESEVVDFAAEHGLCDTSESNPKYNGGTTLPDMGTILDYFGVAADWFKGEISQVADAIKASKCVIVGVASKILWGKSGTAIQDHAITITGVAYDLKDPDVIDGFYICDSGRASTSDSHRYVSYDLMEEAFTYGNYFDYGEILVTEASKAVVKSPSGEIYTAYDVNSIVGQIASYTACEDAQITTSLESTEQTNLSTLVAAGSIA